MDAENSQTNSINGGQEAGESPGETPLVSRIKLLKVPLDIVSPEYLPELIYSFIEAPQAPVFQPGISSQAEARSAAMPLIPPAPAPANEGRNIVLLSVWDLLRARRNKEYRAFIQKADLVIPISKSLVSGARFLTGRTPCRYMPFNFVINLLGLMEQREYTAFLLGGKRQSLQRTEKNLHRTFPKLRIVGRFTGFFRKHNEANLMEAIRKATPHLLLVGKGVRGGELWIARNHFRLGNGIRLWCSDIFDVFAEKKKRPSEKAFELGLEALGYCTRNPIKFLRIFPYFRYKFLLLIYKIFRLS